MFFGGGFDIGFFVDGVELVVFDGVEKNFGGFLDVFEEVVVVGVIGGGFFIGVVFEDFFVVGMFDLFFGSFLVVFGEIENFVVVLLLCWRKIGLVLFYFDYR